MSTGRNSIWIISPAADLGLLILSPLAIIPLVSWLSASVMSAEALALGVFAFASLGHHLPGLMRAYGDRGLFDQYRWRFLLAPPLAIGACWLSFLVFQLHGLELLLLLWATWHILMQTYGFLRIYDLKQGNASRWHANWDYFACLSVFAIGFLFSDIRMYGLADTMSRCGVPLVGPQWLAGCRWLAGAAAVVVLSGYMAIALRSTSAGARANWLKILLLANTALLYWWSGNLSVNLLIGVAMFDIFHAVQYDAIVWHYNRRRAEKGGDQAGVLPWLFHSRWWALPVYVAAIAAFGGVGLWGRSEAAGSLSQVAMVIFAASAMLHFYYDGFIWKVSQPKTRENLSIDADETRVVVSPAWRHGLAWMAFAGAVLSLGWIEAKSTSAEGEAARMRQLAALTPEVPELQLQLSQLALSEQRWQEALHYAQAALQRRPRSFEALRAKADAAHELGQWQAADEAYRAAAILRPADRSLNPHRANVYYQLGMAAVQHEDFALAEKMLRQCLLLQADHAQANYQLGNTLLLTDRLGEAADFYRACLQTQPDFTDAFNNLGAALYQADRLPEAAQAYRQSIALEPKFAPAHYNLALVLISQGDTTGARRSVMQAAALGQHPSPEVLRAVGF